MMVCVNSIQQKEKIIKKNIILEIFEDLHILEYIPNLFVINIESISMINREENKEFENKFI